MSKQGLASAFGHAFDGIRRAARERNFKIELGFAVAAVLLGLWLGNSMAEWAVVALCIGVVLSGECANTAMEAMVDLASPEYNELAKVAKDCAAGAVLLTSFSSLFVAAFVYLPKLVGLFIR